MQIPKDKVEDICYNCNLYKDSCDGDRYVPFLPRYNIKEDCQNRECSNDNPMNRIQVNAAISLFSIKRKLGMDVWNAFGEAIVQSSDDAFAKAAKKNPAMIKRWNDKEY
jgi:Ulp1 family protease